jgi:hypothetical protein
MEILEKILTSMLIGAHCTTLSDIYDNGARTCTVMLIIAKRHDCEMGIENS